MASLGLVRVVEHNEGHSVRVLGPRRIVIAFDPGTDDVDLLRTVILLLRIGALAATARDNLDGVRTVRERVAEAVTALRDIDEITKSASAIHKSADKVSGQADSLRTRLSRLLGQAMDALDGVTATESTELSVTACPDGDAA